MTPQKITIGVKSLNRKTPKNIKLIYRLTGLASALWIAITSTYPTEIPEHMQLNILKAIGLANTLLYTVCQFAGYAPGEDTEEDQK